MFIMMNFFSRDGNRRNMREKVAGQKGWTRKKSLIQDPDGFVKSPRSRRANSVSRGVLAVRRSDHGMKRNAEIGVFTKSSKRESRNEDRMENITKA